MRKIIFSAMMAAAAVTAVPASAAPWHVNRNVARQIQTDINQLDNQINRATQRRVISRQEATGLRRQAMELQRSYNRFSRNGLDRREVANLEAGVNRVRQNLRLERRDWDGHRG